jgi:pimeloyl-ACP methyl ester carboxylesterase
VANLPETRYAKLGGDRIAYQVLGDGPLDLLYVSSVGDTIDTRWEWPPYARFLRRLASFSRLITFDNRGNGASDPVPAAGLPAWENWADDARAVLDAVGSEHAVIFGQINGGPTAVLFAATQPERTEALVLCSTTARFLRDEDYPWGLTEAELDAAVAFLEEAWGTEAMGGFGNPDLASDLAHMRWFAKAQRAWCSPRAAAAFFHWAQRTDVRQVLPSIGAPTLVLHRKDAPFITIEQGRYLAEQIPGARFVPIEGASLSTYVEPNADLLDHIQEFLTGVRPTIEAERTLAAVLFTDIVGSTEQAAIMGDHRWRGLLESHDAVSRTVVDQHRGRVVKLTATVSWPPSTARDEPSAAPWTCGTLSTHSGFGFEPDYMPVRSSCGAATSAASAST